MGMSSSLNVVQFYNYTGNDSSDIVIERLVRELGGKQALEFPDYLEKRESSYIETGITINGLDIIASNNPYDDEDCIYVEENEIIFYVANWSDELTIIDVNKHRDALYELEVRLKAIDSELTAQSVKIIAVYN